MAKNEDEAKIIAFPDALPKYSDAERAESEANIKGLFTETPPPCWQRATAVYLISLGNCIEDNLRALAELDEKEDREKIIYMNGRIFAFMDEAADLADTLKKYGGDNEDAKEALADFAAVYEVFKPIMKK